MGEMLSVKNINVFYGSIHAIKDVPIFAGCPIFNHYKLGENGSRLVKSSQSISARLGIRKPRKTLIFRGF